MTIYGYARVSTHEQKTDLQRDALEKYGVDPLNIFEDKISGKTVDRPALGLVLSRLKAGDTLVVYKLDRLGRSLTHLVETVDDLGRKGVDFVAITEKFDTTTAMGKCMFHVSAAFAQFGRDILIERVNDGMAAAAARGVKFGRPCVLAPELKQKAVELYRTTKKTIRQIAAEVGLTPAATHRAIMAELTPEELRPRNAWRANMVRKPPKPPKPKEKKPPRNYDPVEVPQPEGCEASFDDFFTVI